MSNKYKKIYIFSIALIALLSLLNTRLCRAAKSGEEVDVQSFQRAEKAFKEQKFDEALKNYELVSTNSSNFLKAFSGSMKAAYLVKSWDRFFGLANYYRKNLLTKHFDTDLLLLETLALTKHCQFEAAAQTMAFSRALTKALLENNANVAQVRDQAVKQMSEATLKASLQKFSAQLETSEDLLVLQEKLPGRVKTNESQLKLNFFRTTNQWSLPKDARADVISRTALHPRVLRVYVKNECKGQSS